MSDASLRTGGLGAGLAVTLTYDNVRRPEQLLKNSHPWVLLRLRSTRAVQSRSLHILPLWELCLALS